MNLTSILDISAFIWNEEDFNANQQKYYKMADCIPGLYDQINKYECKVLLRAELQNEIAIYFPYNKVPRSLSDFERLTWRFFSNLRKDRVVTCPAETLDLACHPHLVKDFFSDSTKQEIRYLITSIYASKAENQAFFTFSEIWIPKAQLSIKDKKEEQVVCQTIESNIHETIEKFFLSVKPIFEHHSKHDRVNKEPDEYPAPLSCFDGENLSVPQLILDASKRVGDRYYGYDRVSEVAVVFYNHLNNKYHGHDLFNENDVPPEARQHINRIKNGGRF